MAGRSPRPCDICGTPTIFYFHDFTIGESIYRITKCEKCKTRDYKISDWQNEQYKKRTMICPWCGYEFDSEDCVYEEETDECECPVCEKVIEYEAEFEWQWTTRKPERFFDEKEYDEEQEY